MSQNILNKLLNNAKIADKRLAELKNKMEELRKLRIEEKILEVTRENRALSEKVQKAKAELIRLETLNGKKQYLIPGAATSVAITAEPASLKTKAKKEKNEEELKKSEEEAKKEEDTIIDVSKLDFRIGKIVEINKHPDADTLYVEKIDCGERQLRTVVSGLVNHVPIEELKDKNVMVLCNLKPAKMRGVTSEAMIMCASTPEKVEVLVPPIGSKAGDTIGCIGYRRNPAPQANSKNKIFEICAPDLKTNNRKVACYKGKPFVVLGIGPIVAPTLKEAQIK